MNPKSQPRTDSMPVHAYLVCALSDFYCSWLPLPARSDNVPKLMRGHKHVAQVLSAHPTPAP
jgi:hypothetical protein